MLSVCIPVYNYPAVEFVGQLRKVIESQQLEQVVEIIVIDDGSTEDTLEKNQALESLTNLYLILEKNSGRSAVRNLFPNYCRFDYILFVDCDSLLVNDSYLNTYLSYIKSTTIDVVYGGISYESTLKNKVFELAWNYGSKIQSRPVEIRNKFPNESFMTSNFIIKKKWMSQFQFDEKIAKYGHEDTLFGLLLAKNGITIQHINNPVYHVGLETNTQFLNKTESSLDNLVYINELYPEVEIFKHTNIGRFYLNLKRKKTRAIYLFCSFLFKPLLKKWVLAFPTQLRVFQLYKLFYFIRKVN